MKWGSDTSCIKMVFGESHQREKLPLLRLESQILYALDDVGQKCDHMLLNWLSTERQRDSSFAHHLVKTGGKSLSHFYRKKRLQPTTTVH